MAISHKARYCNGFPNFYSNTDVLEPSIQSIHSRSFLSFPASSGHKSGHILFMAREGPCLEMVSNCRALTRYRISGCEEDQSYAG